MHSAIRAALLAAVVASSCGPSSDATISVPSQATAPDLADPGPASPPATALPPSGEASVAPPVAPPPSTPPTSAPPPRQSAAPIATTPDPVPTTVSTVTAPPSTDDDPEEAEDAASEEIPAPNELLLPVFFAFEASDPGPCPSGDARRSTVTLRWEVIGTESVSIAVGDVGDVVHAGLPPAGTIGLARDCPDPTTYFVVAENPDGRTVQQATR